MTTKKRKTSRRRTSGAFYGWTGGVIQSPQELLMASGMDGDAVRLVSLQQRSMAAYDAGRLAEGDRLAAKADVLVEKIDDALTALEEEGEPQQAPVIQSVVRAMAEAWQACMFNAWDTMCRDTVEEYRRTGHGRWVPPSRTFLGPPSRWIGIRTSPEAVRQAAEHSEWYREEPGYFEEPSLVHQLREISGNREADGLLLLDAAEDAWLSTIATAARIRAGAAKRRISGVDPVKEAKKFARRMTRRKKRMSRPVPNRRRKTSRRRSSRMRS